MGSRGVDPFFPLRAIAREFFFFLISLGGKNEGTDLRRRETHLISFKARQKKKERYKGVKDPKMRRS